LVYLHSSLYKKAYSYNAKVSVQQQCVCEGS